MNMRLVLVLYSMNNVNQALVLTMIERVISLVVILRLGVLFGRNIRIYYSQRLFTTGTTISTLLKSVFAYRLGTQ